MNIGIGTEAVQFHFWEYFLNIQRNLNLRIPRKGIARPPTFLQPNRETDQKNIQIAHRNMNIGIGTVVAQFLSRDYLFQIFCIVSLQCAYKKMSIFISFVHCKFGSSQYQI